MNTEVSNLLYQAVLDASSCESEHSSPRRPTSAVVLMTSPWKPEGQLWPVDTSSQVSVKEAEASLEDIPACISPIAAISRTRHVSPPEDIMELQTSANKALHDLLTTKASIDAHRWRAMWELNVALHQSKSKAAATIKETKAACSQATLNAHATCSWLTLEAKTNCSGAILEAKTTYSTAVKKAKTTRGCMVQEARATCSKAISKDEALRVLQAELLHKEHGNIMQDLEGQVIQEESRSQADFLSTCQVILYNSPPGLKSTLTTSYHILLGQTPLSPPLTPPWRPSLVEEQPTTANLPTPAPKQSHRPKRQHPSPDPVESMPMGGTTQKATAGGPPSPKR